MLAKDPDGSLRPLVLHRCDYHDHADPLDLGHIREVRDIHRISSGFFHCPIGIDSVL